MQTNHAVKTFTRQSGARSGIITLVQRFGSALNLNVHLHMIVLDGVYTFDDDAPRFHSIKAPSQSDMQTLLDRIIRRTVSQLERDGVLIQDTEQPFLDLTQADLQDTRYHGVLAPNAKFRSLIVPTPNARQRAKRKHSNAAKPSTEADRPFAPLSWAERLKRVDIELCPKCGGRLRVIAAITEPNVIQKILDHVHQQQAPPRQPPRRATGPITSEIQFDAS